MMRKDETEDQWRARMEKKGDDQRYFSRLERGVVETLHSPPSRATVTAAASTAVKAAKPRASRAGLTSVQRAPRAPDDRFCANPECARKMRSSRYSAGERPGTVQYGARGLCHRCAFHADRPGVKTRPSHCTTCGKPMRPSKKTLADFPGTVQHGARGLCQPCGRKKKRGTL